MRPPGPSAPNRKASAWTSFWPPICRRSAAARSPTSQDGAGTVNGETATVHQFLRDGEQVVLEDADTRIVEDCPQYSTSSAKGRIGPCSTNRPASSSIRIRSPLRHPRRRPPEHFPDMARSAKIRRAPGIVHRLDKVSGLMVVAKTAKGYESLKRQFAAHTVDKRYLALVQERSRRTMAN